MDPICIHDPEVNDLKEKICGILRNIDPVLTLHDFRTVKGPTHTNIIFDVVKPYRFPLSDEELKQLLSEKIQSMGENFYPIIQIDEKYT